MRALPHGVCISRSLPTHKGGITCVVLVRTCGLCVRACLHVQSRSQAVMEAGRSKLRCTPHFGLRITCLAYGCRGVDG